jgi:hypothetical protein
MRVRAVGLFLRLGDGSAVFGAGMGVGGFVLHSRICGGFGQVVAGGFVLQNRRVRSVRWVRSARARNVGAPWCAGLVGSNRMGKWERGRVGEKANAKARSGQGTPRGERQSRIILLRKTGEVMRFCDHGGAADFYRSGNRRGNWVEIVLDFFSRAVGFLVNGAQRARGCRGTGKRDWQANAVAASHSLPGCAWRCRSWHQEFSMLFSTSLKSSSPLRYFEVSVPLPPLSVSM